MSTGRRCSSRIPQYAGFVQQPTDMQFYVDPAISPWNEIETRIANQLTVAYVDPNMKDPQKLADYLHKCAMDSDAILKDAGMYGTT